MAAVRAGGQALVDGVLMRTPRGWAIARKDGSVESGQLAPSGLARVPVLRVVAGLGSAIRLGIGGPARRGNGRLLGAVLACEIAVVLVAARLGPPKGLGGGAATVATWLAAVGAVRLATPPSLWRYHGAEHKAVAAYEAGIELDDTDAVMASARVHNRCGTNLVALLAVLAVFLNPMPFVVQIPAFLAGLGVAAEALSLAARRPDHLLSRLLLAPGRALQRWVTTVEPTRDEQVVACNALRACLAEEHASAHSANQLYAVPAFS